MTTTIDPPTTLDAGPPEEDRPIIRALRIQVRQALARLSADDEQNDPARIRQLIRDCIDNHQRRAFSTTNTPRLVDAPAAERALVDDFLGFGALERYLQSPMVEEIGIVGPGGGQLWLADGTRRRIREIFCEDEAELVALIRRSVGNLGRSFTSKSSMVDATLPDGSRLHAVLGIAFGGPSRVGTTLNIRKFPNRLHEMAELVERDMLDWPAGNYLLGGVAASCNILIAGGLRERQDHAGQRPAGQHPGHGPRDFHRGPTRAVRRGQPARWDRAGVSPGQHRGRGAVDPARPGQDSLAHAPGSDLCWRNPRGGGI